MNVFTFHLQQLGKVYRNPRELEKERSFLTEHYQAWGIKEDSSIVLSDDILKKIVASENVSEEDSAQLLVEWADKLGAIFKSAKLSSSQLRGFFGTARTIEQQGFDSAKSHRQFILLLPKLQYAARRANVLGMDGLCAVLSESIRLVNNQTANFKRFVEFFEAILAYHKAYGGS